MRRLLLAVSLAGLVACLAGGGYALRAWNDLHRPYRGYEAPSVTVDVTPGMGATAILELLERRGVLRDALATRVYLTYYLEETTLKAGEYAFDAPMSAVEVIDKLARADVVRYPVTLIEGLDLHETAEHLAASGFGEAAEFRRLVASPELILDLDPEATDLEGYLFPDTYSFARGTPESEIVATLVTTFRRRWAAEVEPRLDPESRPSVREVVTLASIVEKETSRDDERPVVAGVYANRLARDMGLYADPTVIYALKLAGTWDGNIRRADLEIDSPYNTYRYRGLPPGPIASPGAASLRAAVEPAEVPYLYFVSRNDGTHVFSRTLAEHNRAVDRWQRRYWREKWAAEGTDEPGSS